MKLQKMYEKIDFHLTEECDKNENTKSEIAYLCTLTNGQGTEDNF